MSVTHVSTSIVAADGDAGDFSKSVTASAGNGIYLVIAWNPDSGGTIGSPQWNGQTMTQIGSDITTAGGTMAHYFVVASASATANLTTTYSKYLFASSSITVMSATGTISASAAVTQLYNSGSYAAPSLTLTSVPSGALAISHLQANSFDKDFNDVSATTWTPGATSRGSYTNTNTWRVHILAAQSSAGAGSDLTQTWTESAGAPMYTHVAVYFSDAAATTIDTIDATIRVGAAFNLTTTGLGTLTTASTVGGKAVTAANAPAGDGTLTAATFVHGATYPAMGTQTVIARDGTDTASTTSTLATFSTYTNVTMGTMNTGGWSIGQDSAIGIGDVIHLPTAAGTLNNDGTLTDYVFGTYTMWRREAATGTMYTSTLTVSNSGVNAAGITGAGITGAVTSGGLTP